MPYKLISLVFLLFFLIINKAYSENEFILPVKKPSIFKKIEKNITSKTTNNLPQKKPILQSANPEQNIVKEKKEIKKKITEKKDTSKKEIVKILNKEGKRVSFTEIESDKGHDSFLLDVPDFLNALKNFLDKSYTEN